MFELRGIPILIDEVTVLKELKQQVLEKTGKEILRKIKPSGDNIMICCPHHNEGQERNPSCGISTRRISDKPPGTVHCFACGYVDSLEGMISKCFGYEGTTFGSNWLIENFLDGEEYSRPVSVPDFSRNVIKKSISYVSEEELAKYRFYHPYMYKRKLTNEVIEKYDVGYQKDFIFEEGWKPTEVLTFPVRDKNGNCLFVSRRSIYGKTFFLPKNLDKPVYGIYELPNGCNEVIICESVINALTCAVYGKPALALFGTGTVRQSLELQKMNIRKFILALDPDEAGEAGVFKLKQYLKDKILTKLIIPKGKDINDLSQEEFLNLNQIYI